MKNSIRFPHLLKSELLADLPDDFRVRFLDACSVRLYDEPEEILAQGASVHGMFVIAHGSVEITCVSPDGQTAMIHLARQGEIFGEIETLSENVAAATCTATPKTTVLFCAQALLYDAVRAPAFLRNITRVFYDRMARDNATKFVDQFYPVDQRLRTYLHRLSADKPEISKTQADLAGLLGCARQTLNRELGRLREDRIIEIEKGKIRVLDRDALVPAVENGLPPDRVN
ncbi:MAG: Crp/Fnr family transcriptional regulator [Rhodobacter sp.]|nr:Crp/Fnr family transcriptional regulator [Rhodobacter sp.]